MPIEPYSKTADANGNAIIRVSPAGRGIWRVTQVSVEAPDAPIGATCMIRRNGFFVSPAIPTGDAVAGDPPVDLHAGDALTVEFTGLTPGQAVNAQVFYEVVP